MGTFHDDHGALHGITVVVDTTGPQVFIGRCHEEDDERVVLLDVDVHTDGENGKTNREYIEQAARFGIWKKHDRLVIPRAEVRAIRRLGDIAVG